LQNVVTNNVFLDKKLKHNNNKTKIKHKKPLPGIEPGDLLHPKRMRYPCTTESTENIAIKLFGRNWSKRK